MCCEQKLVTVGMEVPNFEIEIYDPVERAFGKLSLDQLRKQDKWTILILLKN